VRTGTLVLSFLIVLAGVSGAEEKLSRNAKKLHDSALRIARASKIKEAQEKQLARLMRPVSVEELSEVIARLRNVEEPPKSLPPVLAFLVGEHLLRQFGKETLEQIPDLATLLSDGSPEGMEEAVAVSLRLEDLRLARHLTVRHAKVKHPNVRIRCAIGIGSLLAFGAATGTETAALTALLADEDPAVRAMACRVAFRSRLPEVVPWALEHLGDDAKGKAVVRGEETELIPGEAALRGLCELTRVEWDTTWKEFTRSSKKHRASLAELFTAWWDVKGKAYPPVGFREADFRAKPTESRSRIVKPDTAVTAFQFWAGLDRTRIRLAVDEVLATPVSAFDFDVNFHLKYMAQGMRQDDGEGYKRHYPVGESYVLARKAIGCYVLAFQILSAGRVKIFLRFHDPVR